MQRRHGADPGIALDKGRDRQRATASADHSCRPARAVRSVSQASVTPSKILMGTASTVSHRVVAEQLPYPRTKDQRFNGRPAGVEPNRHHKP